jgi:hypothetical protein
MTQETKEKFVQYVLSYPSIHSIGGQQTLVYSAGLDRDLQHQIQFNTNAITFVTLLYSTLASWGTMADNRNPFAEIIKAVMRSVGPDKRKQGQLLLDELGESPLFDAPPFEVTVEGLSLEQKIDRLLAIQEILDIKLDRLFQLIREGI